MTQLRAHSSDQSITSHRPDGGRSAWVFLASVSVMLRLAWGMRSFDHPALWLSGLLCGWRSKPAQRDLWCRPMASVDSYRWNSYWSLLHWCTRLPAGRQAREECGQPESARSWRFVTCLWDFHNSLECTYTTLETILRGSTVRCKTFHFLLSHFSHWMGRWYFDSTYIEYQLPMTLQQR